MKVVAMNDKSTCDVFLSHSTQDKPAVEELARRLMDKGIRPWLDKWNLIPGDPWQEAIEEALDTCGTVVVFMGPGGLGPWQNEEMRAAISRRVRERQGQFRVVPVLLPGAERGDKSRLPSFLLATTWVEFRGALDDEDALHRLICGIRGIEPGPGPRREGLEGVEEECPYRGLCVFDVIHAPFFFGREALVGWMLEELRREYLGEHNRFLAITGPSGSGKSSVARAGLLGALKCGEVKGSEAWPTVICRPGTDPLESLAVSLSCIEGVESDSSTVGRLMNDLRENPRSLHVKTRLTLHASPPESRLVLLVDQFEELFTECGDEDLRVAFINNLVHAATVARGQTVVLLTLRTDFYGQCALYPALAAALSEHQVLVGPMSDDELRRAIEVPARLVNHALEHGLAERLIHEISGMVGALPLLEYCLLELWDRRKGRMLTHEAYEAIDGVEGALRQRAEHIFDGLTDREKEVCKRLFLRLATAGEATEATKRRVPMKELAATGSDLAMMESLIHKLSGEKARLVMVDTPAGSVEVVHEALVRNWPRFTQWLDEDKVFLVWLERTRARADDWNRTKPDQRKDAVLRGFLLDEAMAWCDQRSQDIGPLEREFIDASIEHRRQEQAAKEEAAREKEAARQRKVAQAKALAEEQRKRAEVAETLAKEKEERARVADALGKEQEERARVAETLAEEQKERTKVANALAAEQEKRAEVAETLANEQAERARSAEILAEERKKRAKTIKVAAAIIILGLLLVMGLGGNAFHQHKLFAQQRQIALCRQLASVSESLRNEGPSVLQRSLLLAVESMDRLSSPSLESDRALRESLALLARPERTMEVSGSPWIASAVFSADGKYLAAVCGDKQAHVWRVDDGREIAVVNLADGGDQRKIAAYAVAFSPSGKYLATTSGNAVRVWSLEEPSSPVEIREKAYDDRAVAVVFTCDGQLLAVASGQYAHIWRWSATSGGGSKPMKHEAAVCSVALNRDGTRLATASRDGMARIWNANTGELIARVAHEGVVHSAAFSPDGARLITASADRTARMWNAKTGDEVMSLKHEDVVRCAAFSPDGTRVITASDKTAQLWDVNSGSALVCMNHEDTIRSVAFYPDGKHVATAGDDGTLRLWKAGRPQQEIAWVGPEDAGYPVALSADGMYKGLAGQEAGSYRAAQLRSTPGECSVAVSPDGKYVAAASLDANTVWLWDAATGESLKPVRHDENVQFVCFSPRGRYLAAVGVDSAAWIWDCNDRETVLARIDDVGASICFSPDEKRLATASGHTAEVWEWNSPSGRKDAVKLTGHDDDIQALCFHPDGKYLATRARDNTARLWLLASANGSQEPTLLSHRDHVCCVTFSPCGKYLATASRDSRARVWDVSSGKELAEVLHDVDDVTLVCFSEGGKYLATASGDGIARVWDWRARGSVRTVARMDHDGAHIHCIAFSPDGQNLATGTDRVRIWQVGSGNEVARMDHEQAVHVVAFSQDGIYLTAERQDGTVRIHLWRPEDLVGEARSFLTRNLTYPEWQQYFPDEPYCKTREDLPIHDSLVDAGERLAREGNRAAALAILRRAAKLQPDLQLDPDAIVDRLAPASR